MPSSYTSNLRLEQQFTGENTNVWGVKLNNALARVDDAIAGFVSIALTGDYAVQSANTNDVADEARRSFLKFTGTLSGNVSVTIPGVSKSYWIWNATNRNVVVTTGAGNTVTVESGDTVPINCDGVNVGTLGFGGISLKAYISSVAAGGAGGNVPSPIGHSGKFLTNDGSLPYWRAPEASDLIDYNAKILGVQVALAAAL